ncbi:MAG TPA: hypothetical protein VHE54_06150 [Puia sp.]|nr:hypothetical protein [Puia sp.]
MAGKGFEEMVRGFPEAPLNRQLLQFMLRDYRHPARKINQLVKKQALIRVKNGLFVPGRNSSISGPEPVLTANHLHGPSYISLETALSYWGLIPERVYETCSVTVKRTKTYVTPIGRLSYRHAPLPYYSFGIKSVQLTSRQVVMMASPEKALCDKIVFTAGVIFGGVKPCRQFLVEDIRIDDDALHELDWRQMESWAADSPKRNSIAMLAKTLRLFRQQRV